MTKGTIPNPYCTCDPCQCESPCTCGLEAVRRTESTWWDRNDCALRHEITTIYKPPSERLRPAESTDPHAHRASHGGDASGSGFPISLTASSDVAAAFEYAPQTAKEQIIGWAGLVADHDHSAGHESIRRSDHNGHQIEIRTTYRVLVDGQELAGHFGVSQDGTTHYHGLPNYQRSSAVDLVKDVIDQFPEDFPHRGES